MFLLILGVCGLVLGIILIFKIIKPPIYLEIPLSANKGNFNLPAKGKYTLAYKGRYMSKLPFDIYDPQIIDLDTNQPIPLPPLPNSVTLVNDDLGQIIYVDLLHFEAKAGNYMLQLASDNSLDRSGKQISLNILHSNEYYVVVKKYMAAWLIALFMFLTSASILAIVSAFMY